MKNGSDPFFGLSDPLELGKHPMPAPAPAPESIQALTTFFRAFRYTPRESTISFACLPMSL